MNDYGALSDLITELSVMSGIPEASIAVVARRLREDGLLSQKGRGRGAAQATPLDAARLCIALMIGGKAKDASIVVADFGQLRLSSFDVEPEHAYGGLTLEAVGLTPDHTFEEGLAALIALWGGQSRRDDGSVGRSGGHVARDARAPQRQRHDGPHLLRRVRLHLQSRRVDPGRQGDGFRCAPCPDGTVPCGVAKYWPRHRRTREISGVEIMPLGEVVAGLRKPGWRESEQAAIERLTEAFQHESAGPTSDAADESED